MTAEMDIQEYMIAEISKIEAIKEHNSISSSDFDELYETAYPEQHDWELKSGASRGVIIPIYDNSVYKIPFSNCCYDYCELEEQIFKIAIQKGLEKAFLPIKRISAQQQFPVYQEPAAITMEDLCDLDAEDFEWYQVCRADRREDDEYYTAAESLKAVEIMDTNDDYDTILTFWATMIKRYNEEFVKELDNFLEQRGLLEDLHIGNIGFTVKDTMPVLIDYVGFSG